jgi:hypothetical protein
MNNNKYEALHYVIFLQYPISSSPLGQNLLQSCFKISLIYVFSLRVRDILPQPRDTTGKIIVFYIFVFTLLLTCLVNQGKSIFLLEVYIWRTNGLNCENNVSACKSGLLFNFLLRVVSGVYFICIGLYYTLVHYELPPQSPSHLPLWVKPHNRTKRKNMLDFEVLEADDVESIGHNIALRLFFSRTGTNKGTYLLTTNRMEWVVERKFIFPFQEESMVQLYQSNETYEDSCLLDCCVVYSGRSFRTFLKRR